MTTAAVPSWSRGSSSWSASHTQPNAVTSSASNIPVTRSSSAPKLNTRGSTRGSSAWSLSTSAPADSVNGEQSTINAQNTATHRRSFDSLDTPPFASNGGSDNPLNPQFSGFVSVSVDNLRTALVKDKQILVFIVTVVTSISHWQLSKRFAQFEDLHIQFKSEFPSMTLPELPPPKSGLFDSNGLKAMAERREAVNTYIQDVMAHPALLESNTLKAFLSSDSDAELVGMTQSASKALEEMIVQLNRRLLKEQEKSKQFSQTLAKHQEEYQDLLQISTSQSSHIKELDTQIATLQDEIAAIMASKLQLEQQVAAAREETARVRSSQESGLKDLLRCRSALAEEQKQRTQWQAKEQQLEEQLAAITEELSRVKNSTEQAVEDACSKLKESLAQELESCSGDSSHVAEIQELLAEKREMESSYLTEIQRLQAEVEELQEMQSLSAPFPGSILHESTEEHTELLSRVQYLQQSNEALQNRHRLEVEVRVCAAVLVVLAEARCGDDSPTQRTRTRIYQPVRTHPAALATSANEAQSTVVVTLSATQLQPPPTNTSSTSELPRKWVCSQTWMAFTLLLSAWKQMGSQKTRGSWERTANLLVFVDTQIVEVLFPEHACGPASHAHQTRHKAFQFVNSTGLSSQQSLHAHQPPTRT